MPVTTSLLEWVYKVGLACRHQPATAGRVFENHSPDARIIGLALDIDRDKLPQARDFPKQGKLDL